MSLLLRIYQRHMPMRLRTLIPDSFRQKVKRWLADSSLPMAATPARAHERKSPNAKNQAHSRQLELNKQAWDKIGESLASPYLEHKKYMETFDIFCQKLPAEASVLDFGCGTGIPFTKELAIKGFNVTGIDISDSMIDAAIRNVPEATFLRLSMTDIDYDEEFDGVFSSYTMLCLDPKNFKIAAIKAAKALKKSGLFFLAINERLETNSAPSRPPPQPSDKKGPNYKVIMGQTMYSRPYSEREIRNAFLETEMKTIRIERETVKSEAYGNYHSLLILMEKQ